MINKNNTVSAVSILLIFLALILGCRGLVSRRAVNYFEKNNIPTAAAAIKNKIGVPFKVFKVEVEKDKFTMQIQSPQNADNLDEYQYSDGAVAGPHPVRIDTFFDFRKLVFDFDERDFAAIPQMLEAAISKSQLEGAEISQLTLSRGVGSGGDSPIRGGQWFDVRWFLAIRGARGDTTAVADERGNLQGVDLSKTAAAKNYDVLQPEELNKAVAALKKEIGDEKKIYMISFTREAMTTGFLDAQNKLDGCRFNINGLNRVGMSGAMFMPTNEAFSINDVDLSAAADLVQKTIDRLKLKNGALDNVKIERTKLGDPQFKFRTVWKISIKSDSGGRGVVEYDAQGKETSARRYDAAGKEDEDFK